MLPPVCRRNQGAKDKHHTTFSGTEWGYVAAPEVLSPCRLRDGSEGRSADRIRPWVTALQVYRVSEAHCVFERVKFVVEVGGQRVQLRHGAAATSRSAYRCLAERGRTLLFAYPDFFALLQL